MYIYIHEYCDLRNNCESHGGHFNTLYLAQWSCIIFTTNTTSRYTTHLCRQFVNDSQCSCLYGKCGCESRLILLYHLFIHEENIEENGNYLVWYLVHVNSNTRIVVIISVDILDDSHIDSYFNMEER